VTALELLIDVAVLLAVAYGSARFGYYLALQDNERRHNALVDAADAEREWAKREMEGER
jgi:hypothetical protein